MPLAVVDGDAIRVGTGRPGEEWRYIFPRPTPALQLLAATITRPRVPIKLFASVGDLMARLLPGWYAHPQALFMVRHGAMPATTAALAPGYAATVTDGPVLAVTLVTPDGAVAARSRAVRHGGLFVYDHIATASDHRRCGLGGHVMRAPEAAGNGGAGRQALTGDRRRPRPLHLARLVDAIAARHCRVRRSGTSCGSGRRLIGCPTPLPSGSARIVEWPAGGGRGHLALSGEAAGKVNV